jgi:transcriptional regulator with XRE-family HTH domain
MVWTADAIRQLRASVRMTQSELARWLGVTVKQVKHLENRRRNPSGPVEQLLSILQERFNSQTTKAPQTQVQVVGASRLDNRSPYPSHPAVDQTPPTELSSVGRDADEAAFIWG